VTGRLLVVYNQASKEPGRRGRRIAQPVRSCSAPAEQRRRRQQVAAARVLRTGTRTTPGDAIPRWTTDDGLLGSPGGRARRLDNQPALDLLDVQVGPRSTSRPASRSRTAASPSR
jgi:hypothetical protein